MTSLFKVSIRILAPCMALAATGCVSGNGVVVTEDKSSHPEDAGFSGGYDVPPAVEPDSSMFELTRELASLDSIGEVTSTCPPGVSCFLDPCSQNSDCQSGFCLEHMGDLVCSKECVEDCPDGWLCMEAPGAGADSVFVCQSRFPTLCRPCTTNDDCKSLSGVPARCVVLDEQGFFCSVSCNEKTSCPAGYECTSTIDSTGKGLFACLPVSGNCPCTQYSIARGFSTPCERSNEFGTCSGQKVCTPEGLSECSARVPSFEVCNGVDDDCNSLVDDEACSSDNPCILATCDPAKGCSYEPLDGSPCDDGNLCTLTDHCENGLCTGSPIVCDDNNPCTDDSCDGKQGCVFEPNTVPCDDGNACTVADMCQEGKCQGVPVDCQCQDDSDCSQFDDGDVCNGVLFCDLSSVPWTCKPKPGSAIVCPEPVGPDAQCLKAVCDKVTGECSFAAKEGGPCDDLDACTFGETCAGGKCGSGLPVNCNDGNVCTTDTCLPDEGCVHYPNANQCEDGNLCTVGDKCSGGKCISGTQMDCDDGNPCTDDSCNPLLGCVHTNNSLPCDDLDPCTLKSQCSGGMCVGTGLKDCDDGNPCTDDFCLPMLGCDHKNNTNPCDDGDLCTFPDKCLAGMCVPGPKITCDDKNVCTDDSCLPEKGCVFSANQKPCDDGNPCTTGDVCLGGACLGTGVTDCDDSNPCTKDVCLPSSGCHHEPADGTPCNDDNACTVGDICIGSKCVGGPELDCDDMNPCTDDTCDLAKGCMHTPNNAPCDDLNLCTKEDKCDKGVCWPGEPVDCDDDNVCTTDLCTPTEGCLHVVNTAPCNDDNLCTTDDKCHLGSCIGGGLLSCNDSNVCTDDYCDPKAGCQFVPNQAPCDDGNACTIGDKCTAGKCGSSTPLDCNDGNLCTDDFCDPAGGCTHIPNTNLCDDNNLCTVIDVCSGGDCIGKEQLNCDDSNVCTDDTCDPEKGCVHNNNDAECDDGNQCTLIDKCVEGKCLGSGVPDCNDDNPCTDDFCDPTIGCVYANNTAPCDDNNVCTENDKCNNGVCTPGTPKNCDDGNPCTQDFCDPEKGCQNIPESLCCGDGVIQPGEECDDGNNNNSDDCDNSCKFVGSANSIYSHSGRKVFIFKSDSSAPLSTYEKFCEEKGLNWFVPKNQSDAQYLITYCYGIDQYHTWIITKNTTTPGTFGGFSVTVDSPGCVSYSDSGFSAIRKWGCSYCDPEAYGHTKCWDSDHSYDWLVCEGGA